MNPAYVRERNVTTAIRPVPGGPQYPGSGGTRTGGIASSPRAHAALRGGRHPIRRSDREGSEVVRSCRTVPTRLKSRADRHTDANHTGREPPGATSRAQWGNSLGSLLFLLPVRPFPRSRSQASESCAYRGVKESDQLLGLRAKHSLGPSVAGFRIQTNSPKRLTKEFRYPSDGRRRSSIGRAAVL